VIDTGTLDDPGGSKEKGKGKGISRRGEGKRLARILSRAEGGKKGKTLLPTGDDLKKKTAGETRNKKSRGGEVLEVGEPQKRGE